MYLELSRFWFSSTPNIWTFKTTITQLAGLCEASEWRTAGGFHCTERCSVRDLDWDDRKLEAVLTCPVGKQQQTCIKKCFGNIYISQIVLAISHHHARSGRGEHGVEAAADERQRAAVRDGGVRGGARAGGGIQRRRPPVLGLLHPRQPRGAAAGRRGRGWGRHPARQPRGQRVGVQPRWRPGMMSRRGPHVYCQARARTGARPPRWRACTARRSAATWWRGRTAGTATAAQCPATRSTPSTAAPRW